MEELAKRVDVRASRLSAWVSTLSGGNQQKVLFAKWLFQAPRALLADEPTRGVDVGAKRAIYELIQTLAADGLAVLLISSELEEVLGLAHRIVVIRSGRLVAEFDGRTATENDVLHAAFATGGGRSVSASPDAPASRFHLARRSVGVGLTSLRDYGIVVSFIVIFVFLTFKSDVFLSKVNLFNVLDGNSSDGIMAVGGTLVLIAGGFDLSVGAIFALSGVIAAMLAPHMDPDARDHARSPVGPRRSASSTASSRPWAASTRSSARWRPRSSSRASRSCSRTGCWSTSRLPASASLGQGTIFTLHYSVIVWAVFALVCGFLLWRTKFGRYIYASGGNAEAARLSGVRVNLIRGSTYAISGLSAGIAGVIVTSRVSTGDASTGTFPLAVIAGIVIGGTSILGGQGAVWRSVLGILLLALIGNGFNLLGVNPIYQQILQGSIILTAVAVDAWARKTSA